AAATGSSPRCSPASAPAESFAPSVARRPGRVLCDRRRAAPGTARRAPRALGRGALPDPRALLGHRGGARARGPARAPCRGHGRRDARGAGRRRIDRRRRAVRAGGPLAAGLGRRRAARGAPAAGNLARPGGRADRRGAARHRLPPRLPRALRAHGAAGELARHLPVIARLLAAALPAPTSFPRTETPPPCAVSDPLRRPFFGDLHVHTGYSLDASTQGVRSRPDDR